MFIKNGSFKKHTHIISYVPPTIITQPLSATKNVGDNYNFFISVKGSKPLNYQWYKNSSSLTGLTSNELNLTNLQLSDDAEYYCEVSNNGYSIQSNIVKLTVVDSLSFVFQPYSVEANTNSNIFFSLSVSTSSPVTYKWYKNYLLYPANTDIIYINSITKNEEGIYFCVVSNLLTSITSVSASLKVNDSIIIKTQPVDTSSNIGDNITLNLSCVGTSPISAQWRKDNTNYGSLSVTNDGYVKLEINNVQNNDEGNYNCILSNVVGSITSNKVLFYINKPPEFILNPVSGIVFIGESFTFTSNATGTNPISYQWIKENEGNINGEIYKNYILSNIQNSNSGRYACIASNLYGTLTSTFATLSVV